MTVDFVTAAAEQKFTEAGKFLDAAIAACPIQNKAVLAQLLVNRGYCQQKVQLYRKALKVFVRSTLDPLCRWGSSNQDSCRAPSGL